MTVTVNGQAREVASSATVADLLPARAADPQRRGVAVAVNGEVVPRGAWPRRHLSAGDRVEIVGAVQGG